ncbi:uncharacterized protein LOC129589306 [Paramacrobiotus metropolitanus]|uniref:uncharacterized protein LOC129589306 n=1 Tax=Paramacrobiotus metropolitanus TaxID=2943436 RepID=UPI002445D36A|nr:uncharacterized protein LOC129589306 [Paramacrobiotus metropolitanus]
MCRTGRKVSVAKLCKTIPWLNKKRRKMLSTSVKSVIDDDYFYIHPDLEKLLYSKIQLIYQQVWVNFVLSTLRFILECVPFAWTAYKSVNPTYGTVTSFTNIVKHDFICNSTHTTDSNWKLWLLWANVWILWAYTWISLTILWLISVQQLCRLAKIRQWRPGTGKHQFREVIMSLTAVRRRLETITVMINCVGLLMPFMLYCDGSPTTACLDIERIIVFLITPWTALTVAIIFNRHSCQSKISHLTDRRQRLQFHTSTVVQMARALNVFVKWPIVHKWTYRCGAPDCCITFACGQLFYICKCPKSPCFTVRNTEGIPKVTMIS